MTNKTTKRALLSSVLALFLCFTMLLGTTYAWFTDEVTSGSNVIKAGNLDIAVEYTLDGETWNNLDGATDLFQKGLWEPGHTEVVALKVTNQGTLALKYSANMSIFNEIVGVNKADEKIVLSDLLTVSTLVQATNDVGDICMMLAFMGENSVGYETTASFKEGNVLRDGVELLPGDSHYVFVKVDMDENIGNEANAKDKNSAPAIEFGVNVLATQLSYENDSFGNDYDALATYMNKNEEGQWEIATLGQLIYFAQSVNSGANYYEGEEIILTADIDLAGINWTPIGSASLDHGFMGNFDGNGYKIKNLTIVNPALDADGYAYAGFFGVTEGTDKDNQNSIKNLVIENVTISTTGHIAAAAIAYPYYTALENITVCGDISIMGGYYTAGALAYTRRCVDAKNITVAGNAGSTIIGDQTVGGVISDIQMNGGLKANYSNFAVSGVTVSGNKCVGGISGIIGGQTLDGATVENVTLVSNDSRVGIVSGAYDSNPVINRVSYSNVTGAAGIVGAPFGSGSTDTMMIDGKLVVNDADALKAALSSDAETVQVILGSDISLDIGTGWKMGGANTKSITIEGFGHTLTLSSTYRSYFNLANEDGVLYLKNMTLTNMHRGTHFFDYTTHFNCDVVADAVVFAKSPLVSNGATAVFNDCKFNQEGTDIYGLWIMTGTNVTVNGGELSTDRGFKIADEDSAKESTVLNVSGTKFNNEKKAAILVTTNYGAEITLNGLDISNCTADSTNAVWIDDGRIETADQIKVTGGSVIIEP